MTDLSKVKTRNALKPRRQPYFHKVSQGNHLGFRKLTTTTQGTWIARTYDKYTMKKPQKSLGDFSEHPDHIRFEMAYKAAQEWFNHLGRGGSSKEVTIREACKNYMDSLKEKGKFKSATDVEKRFNAYVLDDIRFAQTHLNELTPKIIEAWRKKLRDTPTKSGGNKGKQRSDSSLNRDITPVRAALNLAKDHRLVTDDFAWSKALRPIKDADKSRVITLSAEERNIIISQSPSDLAQFIKMLSLIPLRPNAVANLSVSDFNARQKTLYIPVDKANAKRTIPIGNQLFDFLMEAIKDKLPKALIFQRMNGSPWEKHSWKKFKDIAITAGIASNPTLYCIRHSVITDMIEQGTDYGTVAILAGTSVRIIEKNYRHLTATHSANALDRLAIAQARAA